MNNYIQKPVVAKPNYCVPAVLEMVLMHYGIQGITQDNIAAQLTIVPENKGVEHINWGAHINDNTINLFFQKNGIELIEKYIPINQIMDSYFFEEKVRDLLHQKISIICGYNYTWLFGNREDSFRHVSIIVDTCSESEKILILDPGPKDSGYKYVSTEDLYYSIKAGKDGLWCISHK